MLKILGCRGTNSVYGIGFNKYGSYTSSLIATVKGTAILFDMGTGVQSIDKKDLDEITEFNIFFSHLHWDHLIGILGFKPLFYKNVRINFYISEKYGFKGIDEFLSHIYKKPFFPVGIEVFNAKLSLQVISSQKKFSFDGIEIEYIDGNHPNGALIYKIFLNGKKYVYATDYEHSEQSDNDLIEFAQGVDYLIFDTTYFPDDYDGLNDGVSKKGWGHSTYVKGCEIAKKANVKSLVLFHHNPEYSDKELERMHLLALKICPNTIIAKDGMFI
ncbi:MBL fold metallo-hydrolase [Deferribacteraceae bacterium V6Fe1]|nr:MBL fold metallo-hydrolase [Deferribacteraceae bacterium V6Fe1]